MDGPSHQHCCPHCGEVWRHEADGCTVAREYRCERCYADRSQSSSEVAAQWEQHQRETDEMETAGIRPPEELYWDEEEAWIQEESTEELFEHIQGLIKELRDELIGQTLTPHRRGFIHVELEICLKELSRRQREP
jgi:hypothetical protein